MGRRVLFFTLTAITLAIAPAVRGRDDKKPPRPEELMKRKLLASQKVLEGIALNDFEKIEKNAEELLLISKAAEWHVLRTPEYQLFSNTFQRSANDLIKNARSNNLDAAALSYVDLTLTCVRCHKHVREERKTGFAER